MLLFEIMLFSFHIVDNLCTFVNYNFNKKVKHLKAMKGGNGILIQNS